MQARLDPQKTLEIGRRFDSAAMTGDDAAGEFRGQRVEHLTRALA